MGLLVVAYPEIAPDDFKFIQKHRATNDRYFNILNPHFTLVFPVYDMKEKDFVDHMKKFSKNISVIDFTLNSAIAVKDYFSDYWDVFLVPDKGNSSIIKTHDALYKGILINYLRIDIPFIPHMVVGNDTDPFYSINMANDLNASGFSINGKISKLTIANYDGEKAEKIKDIPLS